MGKKIRYQLRFEKLSSGKVREDRLFNQQQRLDAFAGRPVVKKVQYVAIDRGEKTRELNTLVYFAGGGLSLLHVLLLKLEDSHTHTHKHTNTHAHTHTLTHAHTRSHTLAHTGGQPYQPVRPLCCFPSATPLTCAETPVKKPLCYSRCARRRACRISPATSPRDTRRRRSSAHVSMLHLARDVQRLRCCARREMLSGLGVIQVR